MPYVTNDLRKWLDKIEDYRNDYLDEFENQIPIVSTTNSTGDNCSSENLYTYETKWLLSGEVLLKKLEDKIDYNSNQKENIKIALENETFEGSLDSEGNGFGVLEKKNNTSGLYEYLAKGKFVKGNLDGRIKERKSCTYLGDYVYKAGIRHGAYRKFTTSKQFQELGFYESGKKVALTFLKYSGGCYFTGEWSTAGLLANPCAFIYPDLQSVITGRFELNDAGKYAELKVINGQFGKITGLLWKNGIPVPQIHITKLDILKFQMSTDTKLCENLHLGDPYEIETVSVKESEISNAGQGLFAKKPIAPEKIISFYNGVRYPKKRRESGKSYKWSDFRLALDDSTDLDIPLKLRSLKHYTSTLGHKACHTFDTIKINAKFDTFYHPRFGPIIALLSSRNIYTNEEILVNYNYKNIQRAPDWYKKLWNNRK